MNTLISRRTMLAGTVAALAAGAACTAPRRPTGPAELVWATGRINADGPAADVASLWNTRRPNGPRVRVQALPPGADEQRQLLILEVNAGLPTFDVLDLDVVWTGEFAERGFLLPLDDLSPELTELTLPGPLHTAYWDGTLWAAPYATDVGILYYRTDLIGTPPTTWEELARSGTVAAAGPQIAPFVANGQQDEGLTVLFLEYLWSAGGELLTADGAAVDLPPDPTLRALAYLADGLPSRLLPRGFQNLSQEDARRTFGAGGAVFLRSWPYAYSLLNGTDPSSTVAGNVGVALLPTFDGRTAARSTPALGGHNLAVSRSSRWPAEATEFVRFVATAPEVAELLAQRYSLAPALRSVHEQLSADPVRTLLTEALPLARPRPASPVWPALTEEIQQQVLAVYTGRQDPKSAVAGLRAVLASTLDAR